MAKTLSLIGLLLILSSCAFSQEIFYEQYDDGVYFWLVIPYNAMIYKKGQDITDYQISAQIYNSHKKQVGQFTKQVLVPKRDWLADTGIVAQFNQALPKGTYKVQFQMRNKAVGDKREFKRSFEIGTDMTEIGMNWVIAKREGVEFIPNKLTGLDPEELIWHQQYSLAVDSIRVKIDKQIITINNPQSPITLDLKPYLSPDASNKTSFVFYEKNVHYVLEPFLFSPWYSYSMRYTPEDQIAQLRYVATQNDWQILRKLPKAKYGDAIEKFWESNDPSPESVRNENREQFYRRVLIADEKFTIHKKLKGWASDRGRIYIKYGDPDDIATDFFSDDSKYPKIIWSYYKEDRQFLFADTQGYGQYILINKDEEF